LQVLPTFAAARFSSSSAARHAASELDVKTHRVRPSALQQRAAA